MTELAHLNRKMLELEHNGDISEQEYATYRWLLRWLEFTSAYVGDRVPIKEANKLRKELHAS